MHRIPGSGGSYFFVDARLLVDDHARYWSSPTFSIQSTRLPFSASWMAMCVIAVDGVAPCQCFSPGGNQITSPGLISSTGPPQGCTHPNPGRQSTPGRAG